MRTVTTYDMEDYRAVDDNMDIDAVIEKLPIIARGFLPDYDFSGEEWDYENYCNQTVMEKAVSMLKEYRQLLKERENELER